MGKEDEAIQETRVKINADPSLRKGVYSNLVMVQSSKKEAVVNFLFTDGPAESKDADIEGIMVSRVVMTLDTLVELRDALDSHIKENKILSSEMK